MCQTNNSIVIFPLLVHFYSRFLTLFCPVRVCVGAWRCNSGFSGGMTFEHAAWHMKTPWLLMWTFHDFSQPTLMFDLCTVKSGDDRQSALCQDICHAETINVLMWNNICKIISRTELYIKWFVMFYDMIRVTLTHADAMTTDTSLVITSVPPW